VRDSLAADLVAAAASDAPPASSVLETVSALIEDDTEPQPTPTPTPTPTTTPSPTPSASPTQPSATQLIRLSTTTVEQGGKLVVSGTGFAPNTSIELWLHSTPVLLAQTDVGATGEFAKEITIPPTTAPGAHKVVVSTSNGDVAVNLEVRTVSAAALGATGGTFSPWWVVGGLGALVVGAVLILWRRKRA